MLRLRDRVYRDSRKTGRPRCDLQDNLAGFGALYFTRTQVREKCARFARFQQVRPMIAQHAPPVLAVRLCCNWVGTMVLKHFVATVIHIVVTESNIRHSKQKCSVKRTCGHVMLRKSDFGRFMLQFSILHACYKAAPRLSQWPWYASQTWPLFRENHNGQARTAAEQGMHTIA